MNASFGNTSSTQCHHVLTFEHQSKLIPTIYGLIFIFGVVGNALVIFVLCQGSSHKTVANTFMFNLALSDLLFLLSLPFWAVYYSLDYDWIFGGLMCKMCGGLLSLNLYASIFFITCMSVDRYLAIVYPFQSQSCRNRCRARAVSIVVWTLAGVTTVPTLSFRDTQQIEHLGVTACVIHYPDTGWFVGLTLMKNLLGFLLPFVVIFTCYCSIGRHLCRTVGLDKSSSNVDKVLKMVVSVVLAFFLCWFPFHAATFLDVLSSQGLIQMCWVDHTIHTLLPFTLCLGFSNSAINPLLYCFVGNHFREQLSSQWKARTSSLSQKRGSFSTRLSSFSRKLSDLKDPGPMETGMA
ncbi:type-2 angiotensin II receptor-like [Denticeps clupeoides]|uniref:G-protein coupled receptors family 1 profile domain-containing protein n=1 Tax=Denticeps clupeoides TaxID=299321 RepID=A0AAY4CUI0_9TELE|nr:type-2 angiotensin II receptor [Denticeps clupeoides]